MIYEGMNGCIMVVDEWWYINITEKGYWEKGIIGMANEWWREDYDCDYSILGSVLGPLPTLLFPPLPHGISLSLIYYICFSIFVLFIFIHQPTYTLSSFIAQF